MAKLTLRDLIAANTHELDVDGQTYTIHPVCGLDVDELQKAIPGQQMQLKYALAEKVVPDCPPETIRAFPNVVIDRILALSIEAVDRVRAADPNAGGPGNGSPA